MSCAKIGNVMQKNPRPHYDWGLLHKARMVRVLEQCMEKARIYNFFARCRALNANLVNPGAFTDKDLLNSY